MFAQKRINQIIDYLKINKSETVSELANIFKVSEVTIRKDLSILEKDHLVEKSFGGAIWIGNAISGEISSEIKMNSHKEEKEKIAKKVVTEIKEGDTLYIDAGSTNNTLSDHLLSFSSLTVLTNDLLIAIKLTNNPDFRVILLGGEISNISKSIADHLASKILQNFNVDLSVIGCDSISLSGGAYTSSMNRASLKNTAMSIASKKILLATSDKINRKGLVKFTDLNEFDKIYTDDLIDEINQLNDLEDINIEVCK